MQFRQLAIQLFNSPDEIKNHRCAGEVDAEIAPQPLHATKLNHDIPWHKQFIRTTVDRFDQALLGQSHDQRTPGAYRLGNSVNRQQFIKIVFTPHNSCSSSPCPRIES